MPMLRLFTRTALVLFMVLALITGGLVALLKTQPRGSWLTWIQTIDNTAGIFLSDTRVVHPFAHGSGFPTWAAWSSKGWLAWQEWGSTGATDIYVWNGTVITHISHHDVALPPDSGVWLTDRRLAWRSSYNDVSVWEEGRGIILEAANAQEIIPNHSGGFAWIIGSRDLFVWDGTRTIQVTDSSRLECAGSWSWDDRFAFMSFCDSYGSDLADVFVWDGTSLANITNSAADDQRPMWLPNGQLAWIACEQRGCTNGTLMLWDGAVITPITLLEAVDMNSLYRFQNGSLFWRSSDSDHANVLDGEQITEVPLQTVRSAYPADLAAEVLWDGAIWLEISGADNLLYAYLGGQIVLLDRGSIQPSSNMVVSPDKRVAWEAYPWSVRVWESGEVRTIIEGGAAPIQLSWSPIVP